MPLPPELSTGSNSRPSRILLATRAIDAATWIDMKAVWLGPLAGLALVPLIGCRTTQEKPEMKQTGREDWIAMLPVELRHELKPIPAEQNSYLLLLEAGRASSALRDGLREHDLDAFAVLGELENESLEIDDAEALERVKAWMPRNEPALRLLDEALARGRLQPPVGSKGKDATAGNLLVGYRSLAYLKLARARLLAMEGRYPDAATELLGLRALAELVSSAEGTLLHHLVGSGIQSIALRGLRWFAGEPGASQADVERLLHVCSPPWKARDDMIQALQIEFCHYFLVGLEKDAGVKSPSEIARNLTEDGDLRDLDLVRRGIDDLLRDHPRPIDADNTFRRASEACLQGIRAVRAEWRDRQVLEQPRDDELIHAWPQKLMPYGGIERLFSGLPDLNGPDSIDEARNAILKLTNPVGRIHALYMASVFSAQRQLMSVVRAEAELEAARAVLALRVYFDRKKEPAPTLQALVDEGVLDSLPRDPFDGQPLRYSLEKRLLWSVGDDGEAEREGPALGKYGSRNDWLWPIPNQEPM